MDEIILLSPNGHNVVLKVSASKQRYTIENILNIHCNIYSDSEYSIKIDPSKEIDSVAVYINGETVEATYKDGIISFYGNSRFVFAGIIGFVQISLLITYCNSESEWRYSEFASVLIKSTNTNKALDAMLKFVYENQEDILHRDIQSSHIDKRFHQSFNDFWSQIILLEEIANVYESSYGYFMANCRTKLEKRYVLDRIEKLQETDSRTLQYISQHPEYLQRGSTGIKYGGQYVLPTKTMMAQKHLTKDIYENQIVISFLEHILGEITVLVDKIKAYIQLIQLDRESDDGYIVSSYLLYVNAKETLKEFLQKASDIEKQYRDLMMSYARILDVKRLPMLKQPDPTPIFMNLPQYNKIYTCIMQWYGKSGYDFQNEKAMLNFFDAPSIYESYVLIKLVNQIKEYGYNLAEVKSVIYPKPSSWKYKHQDYNNTFVFINEYSKITLYYEPVVYDVDRSSVNGLGIYRNTSISLNRETEEEYVGRYYVPDYILKYEEINKENYLICDAKFSHKSKVLHQLIPDLIYKYITSLSTLCDHATIKGMCIFYGLSDEYKSMESFYDRQISSAKPIRPAIEVLPLSENISYNNQDQNAIKLLQLLME